MTLLNRLVALERARERAQPVEGHPFLIWTLTDEDIAEWATMTGVSLDEARDRFDAMAEAIEHARVAFGRAFRPWSAQMLRTALGCHMQPPLGYELAEAFIADMETSGAPIIWDRI